MCLVLSPLLPTVHCKLAVVFRKKEVAAFPMGLKGFLFSQDNFHFHCKTFYCETRPGLLIHEADPQSRSGVITIFARVVCPSVRPKFSNLAKQNNFQERIVIATGRTASLAEWIIEGTHVFYFAHC